jgi:hypothetical protein
VFIRNICISVGVYLNVIGKNHAGGAKPDRYAWNKVVVSAVIGY